MEAFSSVVLAKGPVGYWRLGEAAGPAAADASGNGNDGTYDGDPIYGQPGAIIDDPDTAVGFNGPDSQDFVEIPDPDSQAFSQPTSGLGLTVEVWLRPDVLAFAGQTSDPYIHWLGKGMPGQYEWAMRFYSHDASRPNRISAYIWNPGHPTGGEGAGAYFQDELTSGEWIHVVACYDPGDAYTDPPAGVHIYKNGVHRLGPPSKGTLYRTYGIATAHGTAPLRLGTRDGESFLTGGLDEVAIYPRVLTPEEILENYNTAIPSSGADSLVTTANSITEHALARGVLIPMNASDRAPPRSSLPPCRRLLGANLLVNPGAIAARAGSTGASAVTEAQRPPWPNMATLLRGLS